MQVTTHPPHRHQGVRKAEGTTEKPPVWMLAVSRQYSMMDDGEHLLREKKDEQGETLWDSTGSQNPTPSAVFPHKPQAISLDPCLKAPSYNPSGVRLLNLCALGSADMKRSVCSIQMPWVGKGSGAEHSGWVCHSPGRQADAIPLTVQRSSPISQP